MNELLTRIPSEQLCKHLMAEQILLQQRSLVEADKIPRETGHKGYRLRVPRVVEEKTGQLAILILCSWHFIDAKSTKGRVILAAEEARFKAKEQNLSSGEIGHNLIAVH